MKIISRIIV